MVGRKYINLKTKIEIKLEVNDVVNYDKIIGKEKGVLCPKGHYTEASLIKYMDEVGVGRPSTYASMVSLNS